METPPLPSLPPSLPSQMKPTGQVSPPHGAHIVLGVGVGVTVQNIKQAG